MNPRRPSNSDISASRRLLENPYAHVEYLEEAQDTLPRWAAADSRKLIHPYAHPSLVEDLMEAEVGLASSNPPALTVVASNEAASKKKSARNTATKKQFRSESVRIFRQYIPPLESGKLRDHHKAFIARNESKSDRTRFELLNGLKRYDLADVAGMRSHFNREPIDLTEEKLRGLETQIAKIVED